MINLVTIKKSVLGSIEAVSPFVKRMNLDTREQYLAAYEQLVEDNQLFTETVEGDILIQNQIIVIHGRQTLTDHLIHK